MTSDVAGIIVWAGGALAYYPFVIRWVRKDRDFKVDDLIFSAILMVFWPIPVTIYVIQRINAFSDWMERGWRRLGRRVQSRVDRVVEPMFDRLAVGFVETGRWIEIHLPDPNKVLLPKREEKA
jgi:hypothetical protein